MTESVNWLPVVAVLVAGLCGGFVLVRLAARGGPPPTPPDPLEQRDLLARRDALIEQLRERRSSAADTQASAAERAALEREAALVLRDLDRLGAAASPGQPKGASTPAPAPPARADRAALRGFLWGTGTAAAVALLVFLVSRGASERAPGGSATGTVPGAAAAAAPGDSELAGLQEAVRQRPDDTEARLDLARALLGRGDLMQVFELTRSVLEQAPGHPRALTYQALVRLEMGQTDAAERMLRQALAAEPDLLDAYVHLSLVHARAGRLDEAEADIAEARRRHPESAPELDRFWATVKGESRAGGSRAASERAGDDPHGSVPEPPMAPAAAPAGNERSSVAGSLELAPGLESSLAPGAIVFLTVRAPGATTGPPLAAKRLKASFPLSFRVGSEDSMMGAALPDRVRLDARIDTDGDPMTRDPNDPAASADGIALGTSGVRLVLRPAR